MTNRTAEFASTGEVAEALGVQAWRVSRLFETQTLPECARIAGRRMIPRSMVPQIKSELKKRGWLKEGHIENAASH